MEAAQSLPEMAHRGNLGLLEEPPTALFCANRCPGNLDIKTFDFAKTRQDVIGGFQALMEKWSCARCCGAIGRRAMPPTARHKRYEDG